MDMLGLVGAATARVRRLRRPAYRFRRKAAQRQPGQGRGKPEGAPLWLPPEDATGAKAAHRPGCRPGSLPALAAHGRVRPGGAGLTPRQAR